MDMSTVPVLSQAGGMNNTENIYEWLFTRYLKRKEKKTSKALLDSDMLYIYDSAGNKLYTRG